MRLRLPAIVATNSFVALQCSLNANCTVPTALRRSYISCISLLRKLYRTPAHRKCVNQICGAGNAL